MRPDSGPETAATNTCGWNAFFGHKLPINSIGKVTKIRWSLTPKRAPETTAGQQIFPTKVTPFSHYSTHNPPSKTWAGRCYMGLGGTGCLQQRHEYRAAAPSPPCGLPLNPIASPPEKNCDSNRGYHAFSSISSAGRISRGRATPKRPHQRRRRRVPRLRAPLPAAMRIATRTPTTAEAALPLPHNHRHHYHHHDRGRHIRKDMGMRRIVAGHVGVMNNESCDAKLEPCGA